MSQPTQEDSHAASASKRLLIAGVGYLGQRVATRALRSGWTTFGTTRSATKAESLRQMGMQSVLWDALKGDGELPTVDVVVWCVGYDRMQSVPVRDIYVNGLSRLLERIPVPVSLVYISSTGVYGDHEGAWIDESTPTQPNDESAAACLEAEGLVQRWSTEHVVATAILRLGGIYGPGRLMLADHLREGRPLPSNPDAFVNLIHVDDAATVVLLSIDHLMAHPQARSTLNVVDGYPVIRREFYREMARLLKTGEPTFDVGKARRVRGNRRIGNARLRSVLNPVLTFADFRAGLEDCLQSI